jgi:hypothetical protein
MFYCFNINIRYCFHNSKKNSIEKMIFLFYLFCMPKILYNTRLEKELIKEFKILAIRQEKRQNDLLEEAIKDLLQKYQKKNSSKHGSDH